MKDKKIEQREGDFGIASPTPVVSTSINGESPLIAEIEAVDEVKSFEQNAKKKFGQDRSKFRKPVPK